MNYYARLPTFSFYGIFFQLAARLTPAHCAQNAVIGVNDKRLGEAVLAVVVPKEGESIEIRELQRYAAHHLADYQQPMAYEIIDALPRNPMGKIQKPALSEHFKDMDVTSALRAILRTK